MSCAASQRTRTLAGVLHVQDHLRQLARQLLLHDFTVGAVCSGAAAHIFVRNSADWHVGSGPQGCAPARAPCRKETCSRTCPSRASATGSASALRRVSPACERLTGAPSWSRLKKTATRRTACRRTSLSDEASARANTTATSRCFAMPRARLRPVRNKVRGAQNSAKCHACSLLASASRPAAVFERSLQDLIRGIRSHVDDEARAAAAARPVLTRFPCAGQVCHDMHGRVPQGAQANGYRRQGHGRLEAHLRLAAAPRGRTHSAQLQMLGYDVSWAAFHVRDRADVHLPPTNFSPDPGSHDEQEVLPQGALPLSPSALVIMTPRSVSATSPRRSAFARQPTSSS